MKGYRIPLAKEGLPFVLGSFSLLFLVLLFELATLAVPIFLVSLLILWFFRDPERKGERDPRAVLSPADGKLVGIEKGVVFLGKEMQRLSIFMSIFDVHVNRSPLEGRIIKKEYHKGHFISANLDKSSEINERNLLGIGTSSGLTVYVVQIAGIIARRIVCWVKEGDHVERGQRIGLIRFGSRVDLYLPMEWEIRVSKGQRVKAGKTTVGYIR